MSNIIPPFGSAEVSIPAAEKIAIATRGRCTVQQETAIVNYPDVLGAPDPTLECANEELVSSAFASGATLLLTNEGPYPVFYEVGTGPRVKDWLRSENGLIDAPGALNVTGTLTSALLLGGIVTSTTGAGVTATLDTGAIMDAASEWVVGEGYRWQAINTGGNAFTVTAAAGGHTVVGAGAVAAGTSGDFLTRKTAADTFITYRIG
jgi:hypothetical protein